MNQFFENFFGKNRFFKIASGALFLLAFSFAIPVLFYPSLVILGILVAYTMIDFIVLYQMKDPLECSRHHQLLFSLGDQNKVELRIKNRSTLKLKLKIIDELPEQLQIRDFVLKTEIPGNTRELLHYSIRPTVRGNYRFGRIIIIINSPISLAGRKIIFELDNEIPVFPSIFQMKQYEIRAVSAAANFQGVKKIRRIGHSYEFEQIKTYIPGDDPRSINWKASGRVAQLMVNQYEDERAQPVYSIIDKSRIMKMPFNELSLLDYAINSSLVVSNIALRKHDKAGLMTFGSKLGTFIKAEKQYSQLRKILQALYVEKESNAEANYELLYSAVRNFIRSRSLLLLYTNFESIYGLQRVLPLLRKINRLHLLVVIFFENTELNDYASLECHDLFEIHKQTAARNLILQKELIMQEFKNHGIQTIRTRPEELSVTTINKYLELKARGYI